jgi:hypothetical protein
MFYMPCLAIVFAVFFPRLVMIVIWLCTSWFTVAFKTALWPLLGFVFMPYTTLAYMAAMLNNNHTVSGLWLVLIIIAALVDLGGHGHLTRRRAWQRQR